MRTPTSRVLLAACLVLAGLLTLGSSPASASPDAPAHFASEMAHIGSFTVPTGTGNVTCGWSGGGTFGTAPNGAPAGSGHFHSYLDSTGSFYQGTYIQDCQRNGVSVTGTGAGQWYIVGAIQVQGEAWSFPVNLSVPNQFSYSPATTTFYGKNLSFAWAVCEGNGGLCSYPAIRTNTYNPDPTLWD